MTLSNEQFGIRGRLKVVKTFVDGTEETHFEDDNLITSAGKNLLLSQIFYPYGSGTPLAFARIGTGGSFDFDGLLLKTPTADMTNLFTPQILAPIIKVGQNSAIPSLTLMASVDNSQGNGLRINEAGFFTQAGIMFNIKTFPISVKDSSFALNLQWTLTIS